MIRKLGIIIIIVGTLAGLYVGGWLLFIQPILYACGMYDLGLLTGMVFGMTILKCMFASFVGTIIFYVCYAIGMLLMSKN